MKKLKKNKIILLICILVIIAEISIFLYTKYIKKIDFNNVEGITIIYHYTIEGFDFPTTKVELAENEVQDILNELKKCTFVKYDDGSVGANNYEIILSNNIKFTFMHSDTWSNNWFGGKSEFIVNCYNDNEVFVTKLPVSILSKIVTKIDEELINRTKELQTDTITIQTEDTIVNTRSIESLKHIVETNDDIGEREIAFTINFNNGTILQIYGPIEFNEEGIIELKGKRYGTIITSENLVKKVQVPRRVIYEIYSIVGNSYN